MNKLYATAMITMLLVSPVAAQTTGNQPSPGLITPDIPVAWQADQLFDRVTKSPAEIAEERAAEAQVMEEEGKVNASVRAAQAAGNAAERSDSSEVERLQNVERILSNLETRLPSEAGTGLSTALDSIRQAQNRQPSNVGSPV